MGIKSFGDSLGGENSMELSVGVYNATRSFPKEEMFGLTSQLRRASVSIASNIAEGQGRLTSGEFAHFLGMARGSALEVETQLEIARMIGLGKPHEIEEMQAAATELVKILNAILTNLRGRKK